MKGERLRLRIQHKKIDKYLGLITLQRLLVEVKWYYVCFAMITNDVKDAMGALEIYLNEI